MNKYDLIFSIGPACRVAYYLELCHIRNKAYPFDWLGTDIDTILHLFKTDFADFFKEYTDQTAITWHADNLRNVVDQNEIIAAHHIPLSKPLEIGVAEFKQLMLKRYTRLKNDLNDAQNIVMITYQELAREKLIYFLNEFAIVYPNKEITLICIHSRKDSDRVIDFKIDKNLTLIEYYFNDINKDGELPDKNPNFWLGNEEKWISVMNDLKLERKRKNE